MTLPAISPPTTPLVSTPKCAAPRTPVKWVRSEGHGPSSMPEASVVPRRAEFFLVFPVCFSSLLLCADIGSTKLMASHRSLLMCKARR